MDKRINGGRHLTAACPECGKVFQLRGLRGHMRWAHGLDAAARAESSIATEATTKRVARYAAVNAEKAAALNPENKKASGLIEVVAWTASALVGIFLFAAFALKGGVAPAPKGGPVFKSPFGP